MPLSSGNYKCPRCGGTKFTGAAGRTDNDPLKCASCGSQITIGKIKSDVAAKAKKEVVSALGKSLKSRIKIKF